MTVTSRYARYLVRGACRKILIKSPLLLSSSSVVWQFLEAQAQVEERATEAWHAAKLQGTRSSWAPATYPESVSSSSARQTDRVLAREESGGGGFKAAADAAAGKYTRYFGN